MKKISFVVYQLLVLSSIMLGILSFLPVDGIAANDTTATGGIQPRGRGSVLFIGKMNSDSKPDTIVVHQVANFSPLPTEIRWGKNGNGTNAKATLLYYPMLLRLRGTLTFEDINRDSIADITVFIRGEKEDTASNITRYSKSYILFGCNKMKNDTIIDFSLPDSTLFATKCYVRPLLGQGQQSSQYTMKHTGGNKVVSLKRGDYYCNGGSESMLTDVQPSPEQQQYILQVFPNPVLEQLTVDIQSTANATGSVLKIINGYGRNVIEEMVAPVSGTMTYTYPVTRFVTGWYRAMLYDVSGGLISSIPFVVIR
jgi:hypothetical protein